MECRLDGRTALVTGGSKGLGLAIAREFARSGANVALVARNETDLASARATIDEESDARIDKTTDVGRFAGDYDNNRVIFLGLNYAF